MNPIGIRYTASGSAEFNDMHIYIFNLYNKDLWQGPGLDVPWPSIAVIPGLQRPRARGRVSLHSFDPDVPVNIDLNCLDDPEDMRRMVEGVRIAWLSLPKISTESEFEQLHDLTLNCAEK